MATSVPNEIWPDRSFLAKTVIWDEQVLVSNVDRDFTPGWVWVYALYLDHEGEQWMRLTEVEAMEAGL